MLSDILFFIWKILGYSKENNERQTLLMLIAEQGDYHSVKSLLKYNKIDPNITDKNGETAIFYAYKNGYTNCIEILLDNPRVNPLITNKDGNEFVMYSSDEHIDCFKRVMNSYINLNSIKNGKLLLKMVYTYNIKCVKVILSYDNPNYKEALEYIVKMGIDEMIDAFIDSNIDLNSVLSQAVYYDNDICIRKLLSGGVNPNLSDDELITPLMLASKHKHIECIKELLYHPNCDPNLQDINGNTALMHCIINNYEEGVQEFMNSERVEPNIINKEKDTALLMAVKQKNKRLIQYLIRKKELDPNVKDLSGYTAIYYALCVYEDYQLVKSIFNCKSNVIISDKLLLSHKKKNIKNLLNVLNKLDQYNHHIFQE